MDASNLQDIGKWMKRFFVSSTFFISFVRTTPN